MSLQPTTDFEIPQLTIEVARAAFPKSNVYMKMRDELGTLFQDELFGGLYPTRGQPAEAPWRLALVTIMQFAENLTDRQTADAVRARIDWKYALGLELTDDGFHYSVLSEFRSRLVENDAVDLIFNTMLRHFRAQGLLKARGRQRTDSTHVLSAVRELNRLGVVGETLHHALNVLAQVAPAWLQAQITDEWFQRYSSHFDEHRLPKSKAKRQELAETIGQDGYHLLTQIYAEQAPVYLSEIEAVEILRRVWIQNFYVEEDKIHWRGKGNYAPFHLLIASPYDPEARRSTKREMFWCGYKVHFTETCDAETPNLITHVETTVATNQDVEVVGSVHAALQDKDILPREHAVDTGYMSADLIVDSAETYDIELLGPVRPDVSWQAQQDQAFDISKFQIDWENQTVTCPMGKTNASWGSATGRNGRPTIQVKFRKSDCLSCTSREFCTRSPSAPRGLNLQPQPQQMALYNARQYQNTKEFKDRYAIRAGVEGTVSQAVVNLELRRSRYCGLAKTHLQHVMTAAAINLKRTAAWLMGTPKRQTQVSHFAALAIAT